MTPTQADRDAAAKLYEAFTALSSSHDAAMKTALCHSDEQNGGAPWDWYGSDKARSGYFYASRAALQAIEAAGYQVVSSEGIRQAVDAGLQGLCKDAPDFAMSSKMRQDAVDHILAQPLAAPRVGEG